MRLVNAVRYLDFKGYKDSHTDTAEKEALNTEWEFKKGMIQSLSDSNYGHVLTHKG